MKNGLCSVLMLLRPALRRPCAVAVAALLSCSAWAQVAVKDNITWDELLVAARAEGSVIVFGPPGAPARSVFVDEFHKAHPGIRVSFEGAQGPGHLTKILAAQQAGRPLADLFIGGPQPALQLRDVKLAQPLVPALLLPDARDPSRWQGGRFDFVDKERQYAIAYAGGPVEPFLFNSERVKEGEITSWWDLLQPRYRGKIMVNDPLVPGPTVGKINHFLSDETLGEKFVRALLDPANQFLITRDDRQIAEQVARGSYWIGIGGTWSTAAPIAKQIPALKIYPPALLKEGTMLTSGRGNLVLLANAPNPHAARVYLNWVLSRAGQQAISIAMGDPSGRTDVNAEGVSPVLRNDQRIKLFTEHHENVLAGRARAVKVAREAMGR